MQESEEGYLILRFNIVSYMFLLASEICLSDAYSVCAGRYFYRPPFRTSRLNMQVSEEGYLILKFNIFSYMFLLAVQGDTFTGHHFGAAGSTCKCRKKGT